MRIGASNYRGNDLGTKTERFGVGKREGHDSSEFYRRGLWKVNVDPDRNWNETDVRDQIFEKSSEDMKELADSCVALMITSPPYHVGKEYDSNTSFETYLEMLRSVFKETHRVLEPGGRAVINVANLGRRPYIPLSHVVTEIMLDIGFLMRGEVIWKKGQGASGNCAWGSWRSPSNPTFRDLHEYCLCFSKGRFERVHKGEPTITREDFLLATLSVWDIAPESARRVNHPAPFPVELPRRFIELYTYGGELVLDPFMGSGTTAVAATRTGRRFVGYETSREYISTAKRRVEAERERAQGHLPRVSSGDPSEVENTWHVRGLVSRLHGQITALLRNSRLALERRDAKLKP